MERGNNVTGVLCTVACTLALQILLQVAVAKRSIKVVLTVVHTGQCLQATGNGLLNHTIFNGTVMTKSLVNAILRLLQQQFNTLTFIYITLGIDYNYNQLLTN